jgi:hypothetical protein
MRNRLITQTMIDGGGGLCCVGGRIHKVKEPNCFGRAIVQLCWDLLGAIRSLGFVN